MRRCSWILSALLLALALGCHTLMIPVARAFGAPPESELRLRRAALERVQSQRGTLPLRVYMLLDPTGHHPPAEGSARFVAGRLQEAGWSRARSVHAVPPVPATDLGHNQLRYHEQRGTSYGAWMKAEPPGDEWVLILEGIRGEGGYAALHLYLLDPSGQIAYSRLMNSHHFGKPGPGRPQEACRMLVQLLLKDLDRPAQAVWPPDGIG